MVVGCGSHDSSRGPDDRRPSDGRHGGDLQLVTPSHPAAPGETLYLFATGFGPTVPGVDFGKPFPSSPRLSSQFACSWP